jgi:hypothetical protein
VMRSRGFSWSKLYWSLAGRLNPCQAQRKDIEDTYLGKQIDRLCDTRRKAKLDGHWMS